MFERGFCQPIIRGQDATASLLVAKAFQTVSEEADPMVAGVDRLGRTTRVPDALSVRCWRWDRQPGWRGPSCGKPMEPACDDLRIGRREVVWGGREDAPGRLEPACDCRGRRARGWLRLRRACRAGDGPDKKGHRQCMELVLQVRQVHVRFRRSGVVDVRAISWEDS